MCVCGWVVAPAMSRRDLAAATAIGPLVPAAADCDAFGVTGRCCCCCCGKSTSIASASSSARPTNLLLSFLALSTWATISSATSAGMAVGTAIVWWPRSGNPPVISADASLLCPSWVPLVNGNIDGTPFCHSNCFSTACLMLASSVAFTFSSKVRRYPNQFSGSLINAKVVFAPNTTPPLVEVSAFCGARCSARKAFR